MAHLRAHPSSRVRACRERGAPPRELAHEGGTPTSLRYQTTPCFHRDYVVRASGYAAGSWSDIRTPALPAYELRRLRQGLAVSLDSPQGEHLLEYGCTGWRHAHTPGAPGRSRPRQESQGPAALPPAVAPVHTLAALDLSVDPRAPPPGAAPVSPGDTLHVGQGGIGHALDLVLGIDSGAEQMG